MEQGDSPGFLCQLVSRYTVATHPHILPEAGRVEAVDDGVRAGVEQAKQEQGVMDVLWHFLNHAGLEPVPEPQEVIRGPAHDEGGHNHNRHFESFQSRFGDVVIFASC